MTKYDSLQIRKQGRRFKITTGHLIIYLPHYYIALHHYTQEYYRIIIMLLLQTYRRKDIQYNNNDHQSKDASVRHGCSVSEGLLTVAQK